eukprot:4671375-Karenia_brevis.AAC.1
MDSVLKRFNLAGLGQLLTALGVTSPTALANAFDDEASFCHQFGGVADPANLVACFRFCERAAQSRASALGRASCSTAPSRPVARVALPPPLVPPKRCRVVVSEPPPSASPVAGADRNARSSKTLYVCFGLIVSVGSDSDWAEDL